MSKCKLLKTKNCHFANILRPNHIILIQSVIAHKNKKGYVKWHILFYSVHGKLFAPSLDALQGFIGLLMAAEGSKADVALA